jgi:hypothetical protein
MKKKIGTSDSYKSARVILTINLIFCLLSYLNVLLAGEYNGDFQGKTPKLSYLLLFLNFIITLIPYFILFYIYKHYKNVRCQYYITVPNKIFGTVIFIILIFQIIVTILYGVGRMGREVYQAPLGIRFFIQIIDRFSAITGVALYIIISNKKSIKNIFFIILLIILSLLRYSLGIFMFLFFFSILLYYKKIVLLIKKKTIIVVMFIILAPIIYLSLYSYRDSLRQGQEVNYFNQKNTKIFQFIIGKLTGRLSSFSNSAIIIERKSQFKRLTQNFTQFQYFKESLRPIYGRFLDLNSKDIKYANIMLESEGNHTRIYGAMYGVQGALLIGFYQSTLVLFINIISILGMIIFVFKITTLFRYDNIKEFAFSSLCGCITSGVGGEFMSTLLYFFVYLVLFIIIGLFNNYCLRINQPV